MRAKPTSTMIAAIGLAAPVLAGIGSASPATAQSAYKPPTCRVTGTLGPASTLEVSLHEGEEAAPEIHFIWRLEGSMENAHSLRNVAPVGDPDWIAAHTIYGRYRLGDEIDVEAFYGSTVSTNFKGVTGTGEATGQIPLFGGVAVQYSMPDPEYDGRLPYYHRDTGYGRIFGDEADTGAGAGVTTTILRYNFRSRKRLSTQYAQIARTMFRGPVSAALPHRIKMGWPGVDTFLVVELEAGKPGEITRNIAELAARAEATRQRGECALATPLPPRGKELSRDNRPF